MNNNEIFNDIEKHLLEDEKPSLWIEKMRNKGVFNVKPFKVFSELNETLQEKKHHPEGNAWIHTLMVVDRAAKEKEKSDFPRAFMWAALLHDIGKVRTTMKRNGRWTSYDHDIVGAEMVKSFLDEFQLDDEFKDRVTAYVRWHMQPLYVINHLPFQNIKAMVKEIEPKELGLLCFCDRVGRGNLTKETLNDITEENKLFIRKAEQVKEELN